VTTLLVLGCLTLHWVMGYIENPPSDFVASIDGSSVAAGTSHLGHSGRHVYMALEYASKQ
jgi:hypothetical protein